MTQLINTGLFTNAYEPTSRELAKFRAAQPGDVVGVDRLYIPRLAILRRIRDAGDLVYVELEEITQNA